MTWLCQAVEVDDETPVHATERTLTALVSHMRSRNVDGFVGMFTEDAVLFGSEAGESATGAGQLRAFATRLFAAPRTYGWTWQAIKARRGGKWIWFVVPASVVLQEDDGSEVSAPYRLSGVLEQEAGRWFLALVNGSAPAAPRP